ncbi:hypothetical protein CIT292_07818 [Citrobacter youngae ATCC 29220]|uniref:Uncharacterized protein n=1 Tax=Citrobacter youngae ATCC 29220 TaxID=500640 RepID=D4BBM9_9ENTR|nr:hypothetical protein CIT292_07818 [Citrobacter youngae ATCC 29220]
MQRILLQDITVCWSTGWSSLSLIPRSENQGIAQRCVEVSLLSTYAI